MPTPTDQQFDIRILLLGGYGVFGGRLVQSLSDLSNVQILIAGRNGATADQFCKADDGASSCQPLQLGRANIADALARERPDLVIDATGPFQDYGDDPYGVVKAAIGAGVNYLDFADGSDFVTGVAQFDAAAKKANVFVLSGVSSFPVLSGVAIAELGRGMVVRKILGGVAPSPHAGIGLNLIRAITGYAGGPVRLQRDGRQINTVGLTESKRYTIAVPGHAPLCNIRLSLVDVPDLQLVPARLVKTAALGPTCANVPLGDEQRPIRQASRRYVYRTDR